jgi:hypothetical protein
MVGSLSLPAGVGFLVDYKFLLYPLIMALLITVPAFAADSTTPLCPAVEKYILRVSDIAANIKEEYTRQMLYREALLELLRAARGYFGMFCPCSELMDHAVAYQENLEATRTPPPGWDPRPSTTNLEMFAEISRQSLPIFMRLTKWCWVPNKE